MELKELKTYLTGCNGVGCRPRQACFRYKLKPWKEYQKRLRSDKPIYTTKQCELYFGPNQYYVMEVLADAMMGINTKDSE